MTDKTSSRPDLTKVPCSYCGKLTYRVIYVVDKGQRPVCTDCFADIAARASGATGR